MAMLKHASQWLAVAAAWLQWWWLTGSRQPLLAGMYHSTCEPSQQSTHSTHRTADTTPSGVLCKYILYMAAHSLLDHHGRAHTRAAWSFTEVIRPRKKTVQELYGNCTSYMYIMYENGTSYSYLADSQ